MKSKICLGSPVAFCENDVGDDVVGWNDVEDVGVGENDVEDDFVGGNDVRDVVMGGNDIGDVIVGGNDIRDVTGHEPIASPDVEYEQGDANMGDIGDMTLDENNVGDATTVTPLGVLSSPPPSLPLMATEFKQMLEVHFHVFQESIKEVDAKVTKPTNALNKTANDASYGLTLVHNDMETMRMHAYELVERIESLKTVVQNFLDRFNPLLARYEYQLREKEKHKAWKCKFNLDKVNLD
ncbi:hypothetical protein Sjap_023697 [Stephania japonica]|uniref:Uncharacterized protein n=1 Tax=Stephania japonica TaxID=461633 RepID=A0AAP0EC31_9MAGN